MPAERLEEIFSQELNNKIILNTSLMNESLAIYSSTDFYKLINALSFFSCLVQKLAYDGIRTLKLTIF